MEYASKSYKKELPGVTRALASIEMRDERERLLAACKTLGIPRTEQERLHAPQKSSWRILWLEYCTSATAETKANYPGHTKRDDACGNRLGCKK